jgi:DNA-binding transcriptional regulator YiaG
MTRNTMAQEKNIRATNRKKAMDYPPIPLMSPEELRDVLEHLGFSQTELARWLDHAPGSRLTRRWASGQVEIPPSTTILLRLLVRAQVDVDWAREQALRPIDGDVSEPSL